MSSLNQSTIKIESTSSLRPATFAAIPVLAEGTGENVFTYKGVGWVKEANKLGRYKKTYRGFRIYTVIEPTSNTTIVEKRMACIIKRNLQGGII